MKSLSICRAALCAFLIFVLPTAGQEHRGRIVGRVADPSGAVVPQAAVTVVNEATSVATVSRTNAEGNFLAILDPGRYNVIVESAGFKKKSVLGIIVRAGDQLALDFPLDVGAASETVSVSGEAPQLETATASISQVVDQSKPTKFGVADGWRGGCCRFFAHE